MKDITAFTVCSCDNDHKVHTEYILLSVIEVIYSWKRIFGAVSGVIVVMEN